METQEHICITCPSLGRDGEDDRPQPNHYRHRWACTECRTQLPGLILQILRLHTDLDPTPTGRHRERVTGTPTEAPLGVRTAVLDHQYTGPALTNPHLPHGPDQQGPLPATRTLYQIALAWWPAWHEHHPHETLPPPTLPDLATWLHHRTEWACNTLPENLPYHALALNRLAHHLRTLTQGPPDKPEPIDGIECRECSRYSLAHHHGDIICTHNQCNCRMAPDEYERWTALLAAHARQDHRRAA